MPDLNPYALLRELARRDLEHFISPIGDQVICQIETEYGRPTAGVLAKAWKPFTLWPAQRDVVRDFDKHRLVCALKARQLGFTWIASAMAIQQAILHPIATVLLFSKRDDESIDLLRRCKGIFLRLPDWITEDTKVSVSNDHEFELSNGSRILAFPTTAGDSYTGSLVIIDEADLVPDLDKLMASVKPTIDAGGKMVLISRADKSKPPEKSPFKRTFQAALNGDSEWHPVFLPWSARPDRTPEWYQAQVKECFDRTGSLDEVHGSYPATPQQALAPKSLDKRFPGHWIEKCFKPMKRLNLA